MTLVLRFDEFEIDVNRCELRGTNGDVHVEPRVFDLLIYLIEHRTRVVPKHELLDSLWGDRFVGEAALTSSIKAVRRALGDSGHAQRLIRTVHRRGYQFVGEVVDSSIGERYQLPTDEEPKSRQEIRFCHAPDGVRIAYATVGTGPTLLKAANWMTHLDLEWSTPIWSHWLHGLGRDRQLVRYDERGCGLSDWEVPSFDFDDWVSDLETVVDAVGIDRFPLLGVSQGGAVAIAYAVLHPERVSCLILAGAYARGRAARAESEQQRREAAIDLDLASVGWNRDDFMRVFASQFLPDGSPHDWEEFVDFQRRTTSPANAVRFLEIFGRIDVSNLAARVSCPTLILHARDDQRVPVSQAIELATLIPGSRMVLLDSRSHLLTEHEAAWTTFLVEIDEFLAVYSQTPPFG
jgi:pimeloyl-ACP methyl ester carboxylesterase/DNA-binding winged helix-turn-helix (wHTH) protein